MQVPSTAVPDTQFKSLNVLESNFERKCQICATLQATAIAQTIRYSGNNDCSAVSVIHSPRTDSANSHAASEDEAENLSTQIYLEMEISDLTLDN
jgi:hypothetical protein